jgi:prepilin-type N-terminal cleavage/methylation domain-containing protein
MKTGRPGFTLFELILAIALAATLLALIGTAINLYLMRVDADRTRVEEAQLARSVLAMIADDIRGASVYQKQDTSAIAQLMAASTPFDVDSIDSARKMASSVGGAGGVGSAASASSLAGLISGGSSGGSSGSGSGSSSSGSSGSSSSSQSLNEESDNSMPLGLSGSVQELFVDVTRLPRQDELFSTVTGYTNAPSAGAANAGAAGGSSATSSDINPPADLKTVHYFVRPGEAVAPGSAAVTSLAAGAQSAAGGLVRQEVPRRMRVFAEQSGSSGVLDEGAVLIAPEVAQIQFRYYDGTQLLDTWDMKELNKLPLAIEVSIWLKSARAASENSGYSSTDMLSGTRSYRQVVSLPMAAISEASAGSNNQSGEGSSTGDDAASGSSSGESSGSGSAFGQQ